MAHYDPFLSRFVILDSLSYQSFGLVKYPNNNRGGDTQLGTACAQLSPGMKWFLRNTGGAVAQLQIEM